MINIQWDIIQVSPSPIISSLFCIFCYRSFEVACYTLGSFFTSVKMVIFWKGNVWKRALPPNIWSASLHSENPSEGHSIIHYFWSTNGCCFNCYLFALARKNVVSEVEHKICSPNVPFFLAYFVLRLSLLTPKPPSAFYWGVKALVCDYIYNTVTNINRKPVRLLMVPSSQSCLDGWRNVFQLLARYESGNHKRIVFLLFMQRASDHSPSIRLWRARSTTHQIVKG